MFAISIFSICKLSLFYKRFQPARFLYWISRSGDGNLSRATGQKHTLQGAISSNAPFGFNARSSAHMVITFHIIASITATRTSHRKLTWAQIPGSTNCDCSTSIVIVISLLSVGVALYVKSSPSQFISTRVVCTFCVVVFVETLCLWPPS